VFPSTAFEARKLAFSRDEAVAVLPWAMFVVPQAAAPAELAVSALTSNPATRLSAATNAATTRRRACLRNVRLMTVLPPACETT
jgi:hypothetical protein